MPKLQQLVFLPPQGTAREPFTTSEIIADVAGVKRHAVNQLIQKHKADFEEFGKVALWRRRTRFTSAQYTALCMGISNRDIDNPGAGAAAHEKITKKGRK